MFGLRVERGTRQQMAQERAVTCFLQLTILD
jgi:hypothetical protein